MNRSALVHVCLVLPQEMCQRRLRLGLGAPRKYIRRDSLIINVHSALHAQPYMAPVETHVDDVFLAPTIPVSSPGEHW